MLRQGFLDPRSSEFQVLPAVCRDFQNLFAMLHKYRDVDVNPFWGYPLDWKTQDSVDKERVKMESATLIFFEGDAGALAAYMGGGNWHGIKMSLLLSLIW